MATSIKSSLEDALSKENVSQMMMFSDDSVEIQFTDRSILQLSPCGANYKYYRPSNSQVPVVSEQLAVIHQQCRFATSETKSKVLAALRFRNYFASRPYITRDFLPICDGGPIHLHKDVSEVKWPESCESNEAQPSPGDEVTVSALHDHAKLTVSANSYLAQVEFLSKFGSYDNSAAAHNCKESLNRCESVWTRQVFPCSLTPGRWKFPVQLASGVLNKTLNLDASKGVSPTPEPLPGVCRLQFRHRWRNVFVDRLHDNTNQTSTVIADSLSKNEQSGVLRMLFCNRSFYWMSTENTNKSVFIEIWLSDGSVLQSHPDNKYYYRHIKYTNNGQHEKLSERIYSPSSLPFDTELKNVVLRANRLLACYTEHTSPQDQQSCWDDSNDDSPEESQDTLETCVVPGLGRFSFVNGDVQIIFDDSASLYSTANCQQLDRMCVEPEQAAIGCRLFFPTGEYMVCENIARSCDPQMVDYVRVLRDWLQWLLKSPSDRRDMPFCSDTVFCADKRAMVAQELEKIQRFQFLLRNSPLNVGEADAVLPGATKGKENGDRFCGVRKLPTDPSSPDIAAALAANARAMTDIENLIKSVRLNK